MKPPVGDGLPPSLSEVAIREPAHSRTRVHRRPRDPQQLRKPASCGHTSFYPNSYIPKGQCSCAADSAMGDSN